MPYVVDSPGSIDYGRTRPDFTFALLSTGSFAPIVKYSFYKALTPMVYKPCQLHYMAVNWPAILNIIVMW